MDKIAVLMSTYNGEKYLRAQIDSILNQKGDFNLCLIVRDDGSKDNTQNILEEYRSSGKLEWCSGENVKTALSFLTLIKNNPGYDYYAFADQDDYWDDDKLQIGLDILKRKNEMPTLYFCNTEYVDKDLASIGGKTYNRKPQLDFFSVLLAPGFLGCTMIFNAKLAEIIQVRDLPSKASMHDSFLAKVCLSNGGEIIYDPTSHMKYRQHGGNVIGSTKGKFDAIKRRIGTINKKNDIGVAEDAHEILLLYSDNIGRNKKEWIEQLARYKEGVMNTIRLALSRKPRFSSRNMEITVRLAILMRHF